MNFSTAVQYAKLGHPIGRQVWAGSNGEPAIWVTYENGIFYYNSAAERKVVANDTLTIADFMGQDWCYPSKCSIPSLPVLPDFPPVESGQPTGPIWDVTNPPCRVWIPPEP